MAEAILFGHRALQPLIDLQEQLREAVGKPKQLAATSSRAPARSLDVRRGDSRPAASSSSSTSRPPARTRSSRTSSRSPASGSAGTQDRRPLVDAREAGRPIVGNQMHGITDADVAKAPPARRRPPSSCSIGPATPSLVGHNVGFDLGFLEEALGDGPDVRARDVPRHARPRARRLPDGPENYKLGDLSRFFGIELAVEPPRRCRTPRRPRSSLLRLAYDLPGPRRKPSRRASPRRIRAQRGRQGRRRVEARGGAARGPVQQGPVRAHPQEDRPPGRPRRGHPDGRPRPRRASGRSRSRSASCRAPTAPACSRAARPRR